MYLTIHELFGLSLEVEGTDTTSYSYDALGNLVTVVLPNHDRIDYLIDGANRRVGRKLNGQVVARWLYQNGLQPVSELDSAGIVVNRYVWGNRRNVPEYIVRDGGDSTYRILSDQAGSVRLVVNASNGYVAQRIDYDVWGVDTLNTMPVFQAIGFGGGLTDRLTEFVRFGARDCFPAIGRWTSKDAIGFLGGDANLYVYAFNDPLDRVDPTGLKVGDWWDLIGNVDRAGAIADEELAKRTRGT